MTYREEAEALDAEDRPLEAAAAYRAAIANSQADLSTYVNLAVLYFEISDEGYSAHHRLPDELFKTAIGRAHEVLDQAEARFGPEPELEFWRRYIARIRQGGEEFFEEAERMVGTGKTLVPYFYVIAGPRRQAFVEGARTLLDSVRGGRTQRERYVRAVLQSQMRRFWPGSIEGRTR
jgi:hypothetical protein